MLRGLTLTRAVAIATVVASSACQDAPSPVSSLSPDGPDRTIGGASSTDIFAGTPQGTRGDVAGLNNLGQTTGSVIGLDPFEQDFKPYRWTPNSIVVKLGGICCGTAWGSDINDAGVVVGTSQTNQANGVRAYRATNTVMVNLGLLPGALPEGDSRAFAINASGQIVGSSTTAAWTTHAVLWNAANVIQDLGTLGGSNSVATDINATGHVVGTSDIAGGAATHFFLWTAASGMRDLTARLGNLTAIAGINDVGQLAGSFTTSAGQTHAFLYTPATGLRDLGTLGGTTSNATGINNRGQVVGNSTLPDGTQHDFLWTPSDGLEDITAVTGITGVRLLNDRLQTVTGPTTFQWSGLPIRVVRIAFEPNAAPVARFTSSCTGLTCRFDASTSSDDDRIVSYAWDLGKSPGGAATGVTATAVYPHAGARTVTLTVTDSKGKSSSTSQTFTVP